MTAALLHSQAARYLAQNIVQLLIVHSSYLQKKKECTNQADICQKHGFLVTYKILQSYPREQKFQSLGAGGCGSGGVAVGAQWHPCWKYQYQMVKCKV